MDTHTSEAKLLLRERDAALRQRDDAIRACGGAIEAAVEAITAGDHVRILRTERDAADRRAAALWQIATAQARVIGTLRRKLRQVDEDLDAAEDYIGELECERDELVDALRTAEDALDHHATDQTSPPGPRAA